MSHSNIVCVGEKSIGVNQPPFIIAEIGVNFDGKLELAKRLVDAAAWSGADAVKFQKRNPDVCVPEHQKSIMRETPWGTMTYLDYKYRMEFNKEEYDEIDLYCKIKGIEWSASPWDMDSLDFLLQYDIPFLKIPSAMITNEELMRACASTGKKIILQGAEGNNLKNITVKFPLGKFISITGVSGSGKSSLINQTIFPLIFSGTNTS